MHVLCVLAVKQRRTWIMYEFCANAFEDQRSPPIMEGNVDGRFERLQDLHGFRVHHTGMPCDGVAKQ